MASREGMTLRAAGAAAVAALAAVQQVQVVALAHAVEAHIGIAADWGWDLEVSLAAGCAGGQRDQRVHAAAVRCQLAELLSGDDAADFAGIGLHGDGGCLDRNLFLSAADRQLKIDTSTITNLQGKVLLLGGFESRGSGADRVASDVEVGGNVLSVSAGGQSAGEASIEISDSDSGVSDGGAGGIGDGTDDGRFLRQSLRREDQDESCEQQCQPQLAAPQVLAETPGIRGREEFHVPASKLLVGRG